MTSPIPDKIVTCPHCGKPSTWTVENKFRPFCSERCKLIDLGSWAAEKHKIPGKPTDEEAAASGEGDEGEEK